MTRRSWITLFTAGVVSAATAVAAKAQGKKKRETRFEGRVWMIKKDESTIMVRAGAAERQVVYDENTKFTVLNKEGSLADIKEGGRVICVGTLDEKGRLKASRVDARQN